jgi:hypothetical protein
MSCEGNTSRHMQETCEIETLCVLFFHVGKLSVLRPVSNKEKIGGNPLVINIMSDESHFKSVETGAH